jgi:uncharacterized membrane protein YfcA
MAQARPSEEATAQVAPVTLRSYLPAGAGLALLAGAVVIAIFAHQQSAAMWALAALAVLAFSCEFVDSSLGMGYGTTLTPLLLLLGYDLKTVVPVVLLSEFLTGMAAGGFHHMLGNVNLRARSRDTKVVAVLGLTGILGAVLGVQFLTHVPRFWARLYFALMIISMGLLILWKRRASYRFSWPKIGGLGVLSAFNKGLSGGGYGPLVVGGQVLSGCEAKTAVGCTSVAESTVCLVALVAFALGGMWPNTLLAVPIITGAVLSTPFAAAMTRHLDRRVNLKQVVGVVVLLLGALCLYKVFA